MHPDPTSNLDNARAEGLRLHENIEKWRTRAYIGAAISVVILFACLASIGYHMR